ncbi:hypothetical protein GCM10017608_28160 [Agromyces luteolus]|uniref:DUF2191 domain-containing protein n=1 Tax=Agromyces luteolus TaxID=88373 RepID=A0A7C9HG75_9MICO|nr:DUF2191 domain-containing protein [Agromyces luteolus]MUN06081.1 DUF2191 domain-containing protein [Agromyces luteolus]GLK28881.1 hypothetical protein GCM10017608_28160 [Agromyces luteolus]
MRTTLELDDRMLRAARALAERQGVSLGAAVSDLALRGLEVGGSAAGATGAAPAGFPLIPIGPIDHVITDDIVAEFRDEA